MSITIESPLIEQRDAATIPLDQEPSTVESYVGLVPDEQLGIIALRLAEQRQGQYVSQFGKYAVSSATMR